MGGVAFREALVSLPLLLLHMLKGKSGATMYLLHPLGRLME